MVQPCVQINLFTHTLKPKTGLSNLHVSVYHPVQYRIYLFLQW